MQSKPRRACFSFAGICLGTLFLVSLTSLARAQREDDSQFRLTSSTFANDATLPITTIKTIVVNNVNVCSVDGSTGGNQSPELSWRNAPPNTRSFVVIAYDTTAAFTHWGMYNIAASRTRLPENAAVAGSKYGTQIFNDFFSAAEYDGPCPPANVCSRCPPLCLYRVRARYQVEAAGVGKFPGQRRDFVSRAD